MGVRPMRILVGHVYHESNTFSPRKTRLEDFECYEGNAMLSLLPGVDVLEAAGAEIIPTLYAARWSSGTVEEAAFRTFEAKLAQAVRRETGALDGIFLSLHGGMTVEGVGSGEYSLLQTVRELAGPDVPIAISLDMHANNRLGLESFVNVMTGYHTAPHTDAAETQRKAARGLLRLIHTGERPHPQLLRAPMLLVGERALSADEPLKTIYARCKALEADERILAATMFVGMAWGDTPHTAVTIAVTPSAARHAAFARQEAEWIAAYIYAHRDECPYAHPSYLPEEAVRKALESRNAPLYLSDSGDNPTAGGMGDSTVLLRLMAKEAPRKRVLFAPLLDTERVRELKRREPGETLPIRIGSGREPYCAPVPMMVTLLGWGDVYSRHGESTAKAAEYVLARCGTIDVILVDAQMAFTGMECFASVGIRIEDYDVVVLKMGYMFKEISAPCRENIMAFTPGYTPLLITAEQYRHLPRPIWPLDDVEKEGIQQ